MYLYSIQATGKFWLGTGNCRKAKERGYLLDTSPQRKSPGEQVVHGLWGLGVSSREERCPAHSYPLPVYRSLAPSLKIVMFSEVGPYLQESKKTRLSGGWHHKGSTKVAVILMRPRCKSG
ncbi:hypothetical protein Prudu_008251 [Prunus dulcis]|uniref:Uncharacterized protein n=1 Tax=Prunus dulcis TaxID=3755 RepID=A0A4Y1R3V3_PRUDU|nr:hypothetical protein Prudu_008251 [Prunus dulcis]